ncbi:MAG: DUF4381 family protein [Flavobacteriales bacterium]|nr:DUF4381 family protein [Flavobacteriales bacterium]
MTSSIAQVSSSVDSTQIRIGEEIKYAIEVQADTTDLVIFPEGQTFLPLEVIESYKIDTTYEQATYRLSKKYGLTQFDSGAYTIPKQKIYINETLFETDSILVEVRDVPVDTTKQKMFDIKPALPVKEPPFDWLRLLYWLVPVILVMGILIYIFFRRKKRKEAEEQQLPPYEEAITALHELDNSTLLKENRSKEYYSQLTEIVKRYLDREIDDTAQESTTDELIARLQLHKDAGHFDFDNETIRHLEQILKRADLVKFAKMQQQAVQASADRNTIEEIITDTHEAVPEPTEEELLQNERYLESLRKKREREKWIWGVGGLFVLVIAAALVYGGVTGFDNLKDKLFGNEMRELAEGRWIKSEYGNPAIIIETPEVLVRQENRDSLGNVKPTIVPTQIFAMGERFDKLYVRIHTTGLQQNLGPDIDLNIVLEEVLTELEANGALNMIVKQERFDTEAGVEGIKGFGTFTTEEDDRDFEYEVIVLKQPTALHVITISTEQGNTYGSQIKERITNSIEVEIPKTQN